jgi:hypothetical protein
VPDNHRKRNDADLLKELVRAVQSYNRGLCEAQGEALPEEGWGQYIDSEGPLHLRACLHDGLVKLQPGVLRASSTKAHGVFHRAAALAYALLLRPAFGRYNSRTALHAGWELVRAEGGVPSTSCDAASHKLVTEAIQTEHAAVPEAHLNSLKRALIEHYSLEGCCSHANARRTALDRKRCHTAQEFKQHC